MMLTYRPDLGELLAALPDSSIATEAAKEVEIATWAMATRCPSGTRRAPSSAEIREKVIAELRRMVLSLAEAGVPRGELLWRLRTYRDVVEHCVCQEIEAHSFPRG